MTFKLQNILQTILSILILGLPSFTFGQDLKCQPLAFFTTYSSDAEGKSWAKVTVYGFNSYSTKTLYKLCENGGGEKSGHHAFNYCSLKRDGREWKLAYSDGPVDGGEPVYSELMLPVSEIESLGYIHFYFNYAKSFLTGAFAAMISEAISKGEHNLDFVEGCTLPTGKFLPDMVSKDGLFSCIDYRCIKEGQKPRCSMYTSAQFGKLKSDGCE